jgi:hypothetical protein
MNNLEEWLQEHRNDPINYRRTGEIDVRIGRLCAEKNALVEKYRAIGCLSAEEVHRIGEIDAALFGSPFLTQEPGWQAARL